MSINILVPSWGTHQVTGTWRSPIDGTMLEGTYSVTLPVDVHNTPQDSIIPAGRHVNKRPLSTEEGAPSLDILVPASDDPDNLPQDFHVQVEVHFPTISQNYTYRLPTPLGGTTNLRTILDPTITPIAGPVLLGVPGGAAKLGADGKTIVDADGAPIQIEAPTYDDSAITQRITSLEEAPQVDPASFATAQQGALAETAIQALPAFANVATTGNYADLAGTPTIPDPYDDSAITQRITSLEEAPPPETYDDSGLQTKVQQLASVADPLNFNGLPADTTYPQGTTFAGWNVAYDGFGYVKTVDASGGRVLELRPSIEVDPDNRDGTTAVMVSTVAETAGDVDISVDMRTLRGNRADRETPETPEPWEVAWLTWNQTRVPGSGEQGTGIPTTEVETSYYVALKPNGWELGKLDQSLFTGDWGGQRYLFTSGEPTHPRGQDWHTVQIRQRTVTDGEQITLTVDGNQLVTFTDGPGSSGFPGWSEHPTQTVYKRGKVGLYTEDAQVQFRNVTITQPPVDVQALLARIEALEQGGIP